MLTLYILGGLTIATYLLVPFLDIRVVKKALGITLVLELFYLIGHYLFKWPFPDWLALLQIGVIVFLGTAIGVIFSKLWPIPPKRGFERILRTFLLVTPALGIGIVLQFLLQGNEANQAIYLIFALTSWLGSGHFIRTE